VPVQLVRCVLSGKIAIAEAKALGLNMRYTYGYVAIEVADTGCGMSYEVLHNVGKP
jgi:sensor histidine kinase regulating citrate/malate metabolism